MPIPRYEIVDPNTPGFYHCVSRCVRRAFLCGGENDRYEHRRQWLENRLEELTGIFAIDVVSYAVMSNHFHVLLWTDPDRAKSWDALEVARRWLQVFGGARTDEEVEERAKQLVCDEKWVRRVRDRLASLSWFHRCLKEPLARMANAEDDCTGAFWEGRFKSYRVVDEAGVLTCSIYVDLNAIRAGSAEVPEASTYTSIKQRIDRRQAFRRQERKRPTKGRRKTARRRRTEARTTDRRAHAESGIWLTPLSEAGASESSRRSLFNIGVDAYLSLVDAVGRQVRAGKGGVIPAALQPILERLDRDVESWLAALHRTTEQLWGTTIGSGASLAREAARRRRRWVVDPLRAPA